MLQAILQVNTAAYQHS